MAFRVRQISRLMATSFACALPARFVLHHLFVRSSCSHLCFFQILPRYIVHFDDLNDSSLSSAAAAAASSPSTSAPSLTDYVVMWIDPDHSRYNASVVQLMKAATDLRLEVVQVSSSAEARSWLLRDAATVRGLIAADRLRVITNRYRKDDGDELAGVQWIDWMRAKQQQQYHSVPVMLFCSQEGYSRVSGSHNPGKRVIVTASEQEAIRFASFQTTFAPLPQPSFFAAMSNWWSAK